MGKQILAGIIASVCASLIVTWLNEYRREVREGREGRA